MSVDIREATPADLDALIDCVALLFAEDGGTRDPHMDPAWPVRQGRDYYRATIDDPRSVCLLAVAEPATGPLTGHLIGKLNKPDELRPNAITASLVSMYVADSARGTGVGTALHEAFLAWVREHGVNELTVSAFASNRAALDFYRARGYLPHTAVLRADIS
jgi:GNAT superfamily N-acetyltransferase